MDTALPSSSLSTVLLLFCFLLLECWGFESTFSSDAKLFLVVLRDCFDSGTDSCSSSSSSSISLSNSIFAAVFSLALLSLTSTSFSPLDSVGSSSVSTVGSSSVSTVGSSSVSTVGSSSVSTSITSSVSSFSVTLVSSSTSSFFLIFSFSPELVSVVLLNSSFNSTTNSSPAGFLTSFSFVFSSLSDKTTKLPFILSSVVSLLAPSSSTTIASSTFSPLLAPVAFITVGILLTISELGNVASILALNNVLTELKYVSIQFFI